MDNEETTLDLKRLLCPLPVIRTQDKIKTMKAGQLLRVICTDPGVRQDIPAWCRINNHQVMDIVESQRELQILIRVG